MTDIRYRVFPDTTQLATAAAQATAEVAIARIEAGSRPVLSLTGGSVGVRTASALASQPINWDSVIVYFGDERFVPVKHADRNDGQIDAVLFDHLDVHPTIRRWPAPTDLAHDVDEAATAFGARAEFPDDDSPLFDVHLLGMGPEGHVNSIFPHTSAVAETERLVVGVRDCPKPPSERMTFTLPAVRRSRHVFLVVAGKDPALYEAAEAIGRAPGCGIVDRHGGKAS